MLNTERLLITAHTKPGPSLTSAPTFCSSPALLASEIASPEVAAGPAGSRQQPGSPAQADCSVARETGSKNRTAGWLRVGEAETTLPAKPPGVILGPIHRPWRFAHCSQNTPRGRARRERGVSPGRGAFLSNSLLAFLPPWLLPTETGWAGEGVNCARGRAAEGGQPAV